KEDGIYWFTMVEEDLQGRNIPADLTRTPPDLKVLVDTVPPRVQFTNAKRNGEEVVVEWAVDDKYPDENNTKLHFRPAGSDGYWQEVTLPAGSKTGVRFAAGTTSAVVVRVTACDLAGNKTEVTREVGASAATTSTSMSPGNIPPTVPTPPVTPISGTGSGPGATIPPPDSLAPPVGPVAPPSSPPSTGGTPGPITPASPVSPASPASPGAGAGGTPASGQPLPIVDPRAPVGSTLPAVSGGTGGPAPVAVWSGGSGGSAPTIE